MNTDFILSVLNDMKTPTRINRNKATNIVLENPKYFKELIALTFQVDEKHSIKAAWVLEWICTHYKLALLQPHLEYFIQNLNRVHFDSATRPCAKICEHLAVAYTNKQENLIKKTLSQEHIDTIIEVGFDWLITPQKIAVRAYTMQTLYLFGLQKDWVHPELKHIIETKIIHESKGCKARGRNILSLIEKNRKR